MANTYLTSKQWKEIVAYVKNRMSGKENVHKVSIFNEESTTDKLIDESSVCDELVSSDSEV